MQARSSPFLNKAAKDAYFPTIGKFENNQRQVYPLLIV